MITIVYMVTYIYFFLYIDYVGFVKRILTLMHKGYKCLSKLEIELKQLESTAVKPVNQGIIFRNNIS